MRWALGRATGVAVAVAVAVLAAVATPAISGGRAAGGKARSAFFGVNFNFYSSVDRSTARLMASGHVASVLFGMNWSSIEGIRGTYDFSAVDRTIGDLAAAGIEPIPVLYGTPTWATNETTHPPPPNTNREPPNVTARGAAGWVAFLHAAVDRYGPGGAFWAGQYRSEHPRGSPFPIHTWQVWDEPNLAGYFWPQPSVPMYADLLRISHDAIKAADPGAQIALGGLPCRVKANGCVSYLTQLYREPGVKRDFDLVGLHPYGPSVSYSIGEIREARRVMRAAGDGHTKIWVSELGWGSGPKGSGRFQEGPSGQAKVLTTAFHRLRKQRRRLGIWRVTWFNWSNPSTPEGACAWCNQAGLLRASGRPKPSWRAYREAVRAR
jgi:hypothetical protein